MDWEKIGLIFCKLDWGEIGLIFFDKLLIGLILLGVGFYVKRTLEESKMTFGFALKFSEERIQRIGQIWLDIDQCEATLRRYQRISTRSRIAGEEADKESMGELEAKAQVVGDEAVKKYHDMRLKIDSNRFWLGDDSVYQSFVSHADLLFSHFEAFAKQLQEEPTQIEKIEEEIKASRKSIFDYLKLPRQ